MQRIAPSGSSVLWLSENSYLKASLPAHFAMLLSRGRRAQNHVASEVWTFGATIRDDYSVVSHQGEGKLSAEHVLLSISDWQNQSPVDKVDYEGLQLDTRARDNQDPQLDESRYRGLRDGNFHNHGFYPNEKQEHAGIPVGIPMGIPTSPDGTLSPMSPTGAKEIGEGVVSTPREKRICGLRRKHFWELSGLILAIVLAAAIIGGVVGGLQSRHGKPSPSAPSTSNNSTSNTTNSANHTAAIPLQYVLL